ncbi:MAG: UDP-N-acetylmuramate:L-alanyl-gamma-D-glutamyl-meso-diaminopimelate ligase [Spirochaetes bacterium]|nr:UDP-N-acetylmuramate:L-alanyl-gamma-D-glutamyl-meso-diaminopimelate ligase [Spirochaetota bacterium]
MSQIMRSRDYRRISEINRIHFIGICGVAMGSLAGMMKEIGYDVSGSDEQVYPPMSEMLASWGIPVQSGFCERNVNNADLVVIGNAISRGNVEAEYVLNEGIPYISMAQALANFFLRQREVVAIAGTHGKTTTSALLAHILTVAGEDPSFFVGGVPINYHSNYRLGSGKYFIVEADEYDSAFFEKVPKFMFYRPRHCILTALEFDHADIYRDLEEIKLWFRRLVNTIPSKGEIIYSREYPALLDVMTTSRSVSHSFGLASADFSCHEESIGNGSAILAFHCTGGKYRFETRLFGEFNYMNICAAAAMAMRLGIQSDAIIEAVRTFRGVKRRQELLFEDGNVRIYEDFAHHPTAIAQVLGSMRKRYPDAKIIAVYEPRSATSRRNVFQDILPLSFKDADVVLMKKPYRLEAVPADERIHIETVIDSLRDIGKDARLYDAVDHIVADVAHIVADSPLNVVIIMSNGSFDGIYGKMLQMAKRNASARN